MYYAEICLDISYKVMKLEIHVTIKKKKKDGLENL